MEILRKFIQRVQAMKSPDHNGEDNFARDFMVSPLPELSPPRAGPGAARRLASPGRAAGALCATVRRGAERRAPAPGRVVWAAGGRRGRLRPSASFRPPPPPPAFAAAAAAGAQAEAAGPRLHSAPPPPTTYCLSGREWVTSPSNLSLRRARTSDLGRVSALGSTERLAAERGWAFPGGGPWTRAGWSQRWARCKLCELGSQLLAKAPGGEGGL